MNRLSNVFANTKLARLHLAQAREDVAKKNIDHACKNLIHAIECVMVSVNNVASIAFKQKPKGASRPKVDTPASVAKKAARGRAVMDATINAFKESLPDSIAGEEETR